MTARQVDADTWEPGDGPAASRPGAPGRDDGRGDALAAWLCNDLQPRLIGALTLYCGDRDVAEELAAEAMFRTWDRWPQVRGHANPTAWAHRVAINLANSWYRRRAAERRANRRHGRPRDVVDDPSVADRVAVRRAVAALPARQREALVLRYYAGLSGDEAAAALGCAPATVRSLIRRAVIALRATGLHIDPTDPDADAMEHHDG